MHLREAGVLVCFYRDVFLIRESQVKVCDKLLFSCLKDDG